MKPIPEQDAQFSAEWDAEVGVEKIAEMYAEALLNAADQSGESPLDILEQFDSLLDEVFAKEPKFEELFCSSLISAEEKIGMIDRTLRSQGSTVFLNFLKVLAKHGRLDVVRAIRRAVHAVHDRRIGRVPVRITTAVVLDGDILHSLSENLRKALGGEPVFHCIVDPEVIGGIVVRVGDTIYDASLLTQLKNVRQQMIDRSAHEIQSRRDRFSNPEGN